MLNEVMILRQDERAARPAPCRRVPYGLTADDRFIAQDVEESFPAEDLDSAPRPSPPDVVHDARESEISVPVHVPKAVFGGRRPVGPGCPIGGRGSPN